jgi:hypothetical protein
MTQGELTGGPDSAAEAGDERNEGRPTGTPPASPQDRGRPETAREDSGSEQAGETVAPEEKGHPVETENAPGSDL